METVLVAFELFHQARGWVRRGAEQRRLETVERVGAGEHVRDMPPLGPVDRAAPEGRDQPGPHDRGLPAPARPDDRQEPGLLHALDELLDELLASEEVDRVAFLERAEALVGVRDDLAGDGGREAGGRRPERPAEGHVVRGVVRLRPQPDHVHRIREPLEVDGSPVDVGDAVHLPREVRDRRAGEDLGGSGDAAQPRREVERAAAVAVVDGDGLSRVQPDPDRERERRVRDGLVDEPPLELDRRPDRLSSGVEDRE